MDPSSWLERADELPRDLYLKAVKTAKEKYEQLEARYGRPAAVAIMAAGIAGTAVPLPGTTFVAVAPVVALAEIHRAVSRHISSPQDLVALPGQALESVHSLGRWLLDELGKAVAEPGDTANELESLVKEAEQQRGHHLTQEELRELLETHLPIK